MLGPTLIWHLTSKSISIQSTHIVKPNFCQWTGAGGQGGRLNSPKRSLSQLLCPPRPNVFSFSQEGNSVFSFSQEGNKLNTNIRDIYPTMKDLTVKEFHLYEYQHTFLAYPSDMYLSWCFGTYLALYDAILSLINRIVGKIQFIFCECVFLFAFLYSAVSICLCIYIGISI